MKSNDPRPKDFTPAQIKRLAVDLKERINGFMNAAFRNQDTTKLVDYNLANSFCASLDKTCDDIDKLYTNFPGIF